LTISSGLGGGGGGGAGGGGGGGAGGGGGGGGGGAPKSEYSSRFGDPVPGFVTWFSVALAISALVTVDGDAPGFVWR
jgi:hypothetical protein